MEKNNSLLFSPDSDTDLFVATLLLVILLALTVGPALAELAEHRIELAIAITGAVAVPALANLLRYKRSPWGCAVLPLSFGFYGLAYLFDRSGLECTVALGAPNAAFLAWHVLVKPAYGWATAQAALGALDSLASAGEFAPFLAHRASSVRRRAASLIAARPVDEALKELNPALRSAAPQRGAAAQALLSLAGEGKLPAAVAIEIDGLVKEADAEVAEVGAELVGRLDATRAHALSADPRPLVRLGLARGLVLAGREPKLAAVLLAGLLGDAAIDGGLRVTTLDLTDAPDAGAEALAALAAALTPSLANELASGSVTPELLWALAEHGESVQAPQIAACVGHAEVAVGNAALEALEGLLNRGLDLGANSAATCAALAEGRTRLREAHPPGENRLADGLVARTEAIERGLTG